MIRTFVAGVFASVLTVFSAVNAETPQTLSFDGADLVAAKQAVTAGKDAALIDAVGDLRDDADKLLSFAPVSVMDKAFVPPSGDKHDYASLSPYWWPDPTKPDGKPYIRRDGKYNPERANYDLEPMDQMTKAVQKLSLAYALTGDERYAEKVATLIKTWFINAETKMNPNLKYAQFVPGLDIIRPSGVLEGNRFRRVVDAAVLIDGSKHWTADDDAALKAWFARFLDYLVTSEQGKEEASQPNNHGTWFHVQAATYALYLGEEARARSLLETGFKDGLANQFTAEGLQPKEVTRTRSLHYHRYNLLAFFELAMLGDHLKLDLWNFKTSDGKSLRTGLDFLTPFALGEQKWPHEQIDEVKPKDLAHLYRRAANAYGEPKYEQLNERLGKAGAEESDLGLIMFPSRTH
jgi:hypothetical protein